MNIDDVLSGIVYIESENAIQHNFNLKCDMSLISNAIFW